MKILEMDAGNTRLKWRLLKGAEVTDSGFLANSESWSETLPDCWIDAELSMQPGLR